MHSMRQAWCFALALALVTACAKDEFAAPAAGGQEPAGATEPVAASAPPPQFEGETRSQVRVVPAAAPDAPARLEVRAWTRDGRPVPGLEYSIYWQTDEGPSLTKGTLGENGWSHSVFPASALIHRVFVHPTGYTTSLMAEVNQYVQPGSTLCVDGLILPAAVVSGVVVDENGAPLAGAMIAGFQRPIADVDESERPAADTAGPASEDGTFRLGGFSPGTFVLEAIVPDHVNTWRVVGVLEEGQEITGLELQMEPAHTVHGQVLSADDEPVAGARVVAGKPGRRQLSRPGPTEQIVFVPARQMVTRTDERGIFQLHTVPDAQEWNLNVDHPRFRRHIGRLEAGQLDVVVRLERGLEVRGNVFDSAGARLHEVTVVLLGGEEAVVARTNRQGVFVLAGLDEAAGRYLYLVHAEHAPLLHGPVDLSGGTPLELRMLAPAQLTGTLSDARGQPVGGARITLHAENLPDGFPVAAYPPELASRQSGLSSASGTFLFDGIPAGSYRAEVVTADGRRQEFPGLATGGAALELALTAER